MTVETRIRCDGCRRTTDIGPRTQWAQRQELRKHGWVGSPGGLDYCPECVTAGRSTYGRRQTVTVQDVLDGRTASGDTPIGPQHLGETPENPVQ